MNIELIKEEIGDNIIKNIFYIDEKYGKDAAVDFISSLTEEEMEILCEQTNKKVQVGFKWNYDKARSAYDKFRNSKIGSYLDPAASFTLPYYDAAVQAGVSGDMEAAGKSFAADTALVAAGGPLARGARWGMNKVADTAVGRTVGRGYKAGTEFAQNLYNRLKGTTGAKSVKPPRVNASPAGSAAPQTAAQSQQAARGGAVTGGAITQTRPNSIAPRLPAPSNKPAATVPALRPALPSSLKPATSGAPVASAPSGPPASFTKPSKLGTSITAAGIGAEVARRSIAPSTPAPSTPAPMPNIPLNRPTQPQPAPLQAAATQAPSAAPATQTVKPIAKPQPRANVPAKKSVQRQAAKPSPSRPTFSTGTSSLGSHMSRSMGGLGEETNFQLKESFETFIRHKYNKRDLI